MQRLGGNTYRVAEVLQSAMQCLRSSNKLHIVYHNVSFQCITTTQTQSLQANTRAQSECRQAACPPYTDLHMINTCLCVPYSPQSADLLEHTTPATAFPSGLGAPTEGSAENKPASQSRSRLLGAFNGTMLRKRQGKLRNSWCGNSFFYCDDRFLLATVLLLPCLCPLPYLV